jgi:hypothetical protein
MKQGPIFCDMINVDGNYQNGRDHFSRSAHDLEMRLKEKGLKSSKCHNSGIYQRTKRIRMDSLIVYAAVRRFLVSFTIIVTLAFDTGSGQIYKN